jgi:ABC-2 type transport system ATP-binding protein
MIAVNIHNISKSYGDIVAVRELNLSVPAGSVYGFIGPNGSGKTTTLRMIMNIIMPDSGTIEVFGEQLRQTATDQIGYLPEERGLYLKMRVRELLHFYGDLKNGRDLKQKIEHWLDLFELTEYGDKKVETLSKGMTQKVQFIATVVSEPRLLILDEPFTGLDPVNADVIREAVLGLQKKGITVIFSTHDMNVAEKMCDFICMIYKGEKVLDGTLDSIQDQYGSDSLLIRPEDGSVDLSQIPAIESVTDLGKLQEIRISRNSDLQTVLKSILEISRLRSFEIARPSLHDIFVRIVKGDGKGDGIGELG